MISEYVGDRRSGINQAVSEDIGSVFKGKTMVQLQSLEEKIRDKLKGGEGIDIGQWLTQSVSSAAGHCWFL